MSMEETTKCCNTCISCACNLEHRDKIGVDEDGKPKGTGCIGWENPRLVGQAYTKLMKQNIR